MRGFFACFILTIVCWSDQSVSAQDLAEQFGALPRFEDMKLSPSGKQVAVTENTETGTEVLVIDLATMTPRVKVPVSGLKVRGTIWVNEDKLIVRGTDTSGYYGSLRGKYEYSEVYAIDLKRQSAKQLLVGTKGISDRQSVGWIAAVDESGDYVYMGAPQRTFGRWEYNLFKVSLSHGKGVIHSIGDFTTLDYAVGTDGTLLARERYGAKSDEYILEVPGGVDGWTTIFRDKFRRPRYSLIGVMPDQKTFLIAATYESEQGDGFYLLSPDNPTLKPYLSESRGKDVSSTLSTNGIIDGFRFGGARPSYDFFDDGLDQIYNEFARQIPGASVYLSSWSDDKSKLLFTVYTGLGGTGTFFLIDRDSGGIQKLGSRYPDIPQESVGDVHTIEYAARDGIPIEAIVTWPPEIRPDEKSGLSMVVLPHGGPASHDTVSFDYMAQYFASKGYVVLQPNFRGSTGYGSDFYQAGKGEWGNKMQTDLIDGIDAMAERGWVDKEKVCIAGWSYGGYAALAAGAFEAGRFKCVISGGGISSLPRMVKAAYDRNGQWSTALDYWKEVMAGPDGGQAKMEVVSPVKYAEQFSAPVLLIHGDDDTVVQIEQSEIMENALKRESKTVEFVRLKDEDHWLSRRETRIEALAAMGAFLDKYLPIDENANVN
ncbi:MAG: hypothetical protein CMK07_15075 [Ponticaulis sp.]|nr:hypothetical protein [Ponticaulis sp.]